MINNYLLWNYPGVDLCEQVAKEYFKSNSWLEKQRLLDTLERLFDNTYIYCFSEFLSFFKFRRYLYITEYNRNTMDVM